MASRPQTRLFVTGFILLLVIQLTGWTCRDEWPIASSHASPTGWSQSVTQTVDMGQIGDDGCPCHLAFVSVPNAALATCCPIQGLAIEAPTAAPPGPVTLPFHPPLVA